MLTVKDAILKRRSIRTFRRTPVDEATITELLEAARWAPSGCNAQPWRFKVVRDGETRERIASAAYRQQFVAKAPVVLVCCADIARYLDGSVSGIQDLGRIGAVEDRIVEILCDRIGRMRKMPIEQVGHAVAVNVAIAVEHIALRALDFGLGSCWVRLFEEQKVKKLFGWKDDLHVVCLLALGYPAESPEPRPRMNIEDLIIE